MRATTERLRTHPFLAGLDEESLERIATISTVVALDAKTWLFREGDPADRCWLIRSGRVNLDVHLPGRGEVIVESLGAGAVLGWSWLFPPYRWHFDAVVVEPTSAIEVDGIQLRALCQTDPKLGYRLGQMFTAVLIERLQATRLRLLDLYGPPR